MSTGASPPTGGASPPLQGSPGGVITVVKSTARQVDAVEQQLQALASALAHGGGAQAATLRHLELFEAAVQGLKDSAEEAAARRDELLVAAKRLALELRGLDLLAGHVQAVYELVRKLEAQAAEVIRSAGGGSTTREHHSCLHAMSSEADGLDAAEQERPLVVSIQPNAIVDHLCVIRDEAELKALVPDEIGGSHRVELSEIQHILTTVGEYFSKAGGSAANTTRGLAGFGVKTQLLGCRGFDEWGAFWASSMKRCHVGVERMAVKQGPTARSCILSCGGQRTMRTCMTGCPRLEPEELRPEDFEGAAWAFLSAYCLYVPGLLERAVELARSAGASVALELASFEVVRAFSQNIKSLLEGGAVDVAFCNEDEAMELAGGSPEEGLDYLAQHCRRLGVVTLGEKGCLIKESGADDVIAMPACAGVKAVDTTGAGDLFAAGFLYSLINGMDLRRCGEIGCMAGGAVVQTLGAEMGRDQWSWLHQRMHGELAGAVVRDSAAAVQQELLACFALIEKMGRGPVYYGSARLKQDSPHWERAVQLGRDVANLLGSTTWSGGGPGMMEAATQGALLAGQRVAGIRIQREAGTTVLTASYLPTGSQVHCRYLSSRKVALVDSGVRMKESDRTAYIFLPGGLGTLDEFFEILTLVQLRKLGTKFPVPIILVDYDGFYAGLLQFMKACNDHGTVGAPELRDLVVAHDNEGVLDVLRQYYKLEDGEGVKRSSPSKVYRASAFLQLGGSEERAEAAGL